MRSSTVVLVLLSALVGCKAEEPQEATRETELVRKPKPKVKETRHTSIRGKEDAGPDAASLAAGRAEKAARRCEGGSGNAELGAGEAADGAKDAKQAAKAARGAAGKGKRAAAKSAAARAGKAADKAGKSAAWARRMAARSRRALERAKRAAAEVERAAGAGHPARARARKAVARAEKATRAAEAFSKQARKSADAAEAAARAALNADKGAAKAAAQKRARARALAKAREKAKAEAAARERARLLAKARRKGTGGKHTKRGDKDDERGGEAHVEAKKKIDPRDIPELPDAPKKEAKGVEIPRDTPTPVAKLERWRQSGGSQGADFCPGGYATSVLHFRIDGILEVQRTFGKGKSKIAQTWRVGYRWSTDRSKLYLGEEKVNRPDPASLKGIKLPSMGIEMSDAKLTFPVTLEVRALTGDRLSVAGRTFVRERTKK